MIPYENFINRKVRQMTHYRMLLNEYRYTFEWSIEYLNVTYCDICRIYILPKYESVLLNLSCFHIIVNSSNLNEYKVIQPYFDETIDAYIEMELIKFPKATYNRENVIKWVESYILSDTGLTTVLKHGNWITNLLSSSEIDRLLHDISINVDNDLL